MNRTTTLRLPEDLLKEIDALVKEAHLDRSSYLRDIIRKGFDIDRRERVLQRYERRELSLGQACSKLGVDAWGFFEMLKESQHSINVTLEDLLDSASL